MGDPSQRTGLLRRLARGTLRRALAGLTVALLVAATAAPSAGAAVGSLLRQVTAANPQVCSVNVGIAFDGQYLLESCVDNGTTGLASIDFVNPSSGAVANSLYVSGHNGFAAITYDAKRDALWACDAPSGNSPSTGTTLYLINLSNGSSTKQFTVADSCWDGLAWDPADDTIWTSGDQSDSVYHYTTGGRLIHLFTGATKLLGGTDGNSGIAVGGRNLYLANPGPGTIYTVPKDFSNSTLTATEPNHIEGMACDPLTFAPKEAMWVVSAFDRGLNAYEIPAGTCDPPPPPPVLGKAVNAGLVSGTVYVKLPASSPAYSTDATVAAFTKGRGFVPLTVARQLPVGTMVDARRGTLAMSAAGLPGGKLQRARMAGAVFSVAQPARGPVKGLTILSLLEDAFPGAPSFKRTCGAHANADAAFADPLATIAVKPRVLQTLRVRAAGRFRTRGRFAAATVRGTGWDMIDRCDGTLTVVHKGTVAVTDFRNRKTIPVRAGKQLFVPAH